MCSRCPVQQFGTPFIAHRGQGGRRVVIYSHIILGLNYVNSDGSAKLSESVLESGFIINVRPIPSTSLERSCL
jgi:hypothetical protein